MKKKMFWGICLFIFLAASLFAQSLGDVNNTGQVDIVDALLIAQYYVGLNPGGFDSGVSDVDCSGNIDIVDALLVAQYYVGLISEFPCGSPVPTSVPTPQPTNSEEIIQPPPLSSFDWVLSTDPDLNKDVDVIDIDAFSATADLVEYFHSKGTLVIAYISAGSWESWRPDIDLIPPECIGNDYPGWDGEKFLDIRQLDKLTPIMTSRMDMIKSKGFDGVEPDNMDCYENDTGFPLTRQDGINYALWLADLAHSRGLSIGQKNAPNIAGELVDVYDWALLESGFEYNFYAVFSGYIDRNKAVFDTEYSDNNFSLYCQEALLQQITLIRKNLDLDNWIQTCN